MKKVYEELLGVFTDFYIMANSPQRDARLIEEAGVELDRALYPLLIGIEKFEPTGVVELSDKVGRDYTTVSRQLAKLESLGLIKRESSKNDSRVKEASLTAKGRHSIKKLTQARDLMISSALDAWKDRDLEDATRLLRRLIDDLNAV